MILKISGVIRTYKLRAVLLFEDDFNFANKFYFGIRYTKRAESSGVIPQVQHGDISEHKSIEVALLRSIFFDYITWKIQCTDIDGYTQGSLTTTTQVENK